MSFWRVTDGEQQTPPASFVTKAARRKEVRALLFELVWFQADIIRTPRWKRICVALRSGQLFFSNVPTTKAVYSTRAHYRLCRVSYGNSKTMWGLLRLQNRKFIASPLYWGRSDDLLRDFAASAAGDCAERTVPRNLVQFYFCRVATSLCFQCQCFFFCTL